MKIVKNSSPRQSGFTLVEVMVAVAIFAIAGGAVMKSVYEHLRSISIIEQVTMATWVANNELTRSTLEANIKWPLDKTTKGESKMAGQQWYWQREAIKTSDEAIYQITISVSENEDMSNTITSVKTFMGKPLQ